MTDNQIRAYEIAEAKRLNDLEEKRLAEEQRKARENESLQTARNKDIQEKSRALDIASVVSGVAKLIGKAGSMLL